MNLLHGQHFPSKTLYFPFPHNLSLVKMDHILRNNPPLNQTRSFLQFSSGSLPTTCSFLFFHLVYLNMVFFLFYFPIRNKTLQPMIYLSQQQLLQYGESLNNSLNAPCSFVFFFKENNCYTLLTLILKSRFYDENLTPLNVYFDLCSQ